MSLLDSLSRLWDRPNNIFSTTFVDRSNFYYTSTLFAILCTFYVLSDEVIGDPIDCWTPEYFTSQWIQFVDNICWMKSTYYLPFNTSVEQGREHDLTWEVKYYQWVPIIFAALAVLFYVPNLFWKSVVKSTINLNFLVRELNEGESATNCEHRAKCAKKIAKTLHHYFENRLDFDPGKTEPSKGSRFKKFLGKSWFFSWYFWNDYGSFLAPCYLFVKVIYIGINLFTIYFLRLMLGPGFYSYGIDVGSNFIASSDWKSISSNIFPKVTLCDIEIREIGQPRVQTVQCVLTINLFNEKIFTVVWFWLVLLLIFTCFSLLWWFYKVKLFSVRSRKALSLLHSSVELAQYQDVELTDPEFEYFVRDYLKCDGSFIFEIIEANSMAFVSSDLMAEVWSRFKFQGWLQKFKMPQDEKVHDDKKKPSNFRFCFPRKPKGVKKKENIHDNVVHRRGQSFKELMEHADFSSTHLSQNETLAHRPKRRDVISGGEINSREPQLNPQKSQLNADSVSWVTKPKDRKMLLDRFLDECSPDNPVEQDDRMEVN